jgi:hypothetical protein
MWTLLVSAALSGAWPLTIAAATGGAGQQTLHASEGQALSRESIVRYVDPADEHGPQRLRICNAYEYQAPMEFVFASTHAEIGTLDYATCKEFHLKISDGDEIDFKVKGAFVGAFAVNALPQGSKTLLLTISRRGGNSMAATFQSHAFDLEDSGEYSQVAVIDTTHGDKNSKTVSIVAQDASTNSTGEDIPMNSAVAVAPGKYRIKLHGDIDKKFVVEPRTNYVILHIGRRSLPHAREGKTLLAVSDSKEDLVIYPDSLLERVNSLAPRGAAASLGFLLLLAAQAAMISEL